MVTMHCFTRGTGCMVTGNMVIGQKDYMSKRSWTKKGRRSKGSQVKMVTGHKGHRSKGSQVKRVTGQKGLMSKRSQVKNVAG